MATRTSRPKLRSIETIVVTGDDGRRELVLRDTQGITSSQVSMPLALSAVVSLFDGRHDCSEIARRAAARLDQDVPVELVVKLATDLEDALFCEGPAFEQAQEEVRARFSASPARPASHAGGAYHRDPIKLGAYLRDDCIAAAHAVSRPSGVLRGLVAPHIDPWRGAVGYGHAYANFRARIPSDTETFVLLGTSHAPMREPFALCRKGFDTPLGVVPCDEGSVDALANASRFDPYADQLNHLREHSIEFQAVFLRHAMEDRPCRIVPILCGLGEAQANGTDPVQAPDIARFLDALREVVHRTNAVVIAGADMAHVGPRFGDGAAYDPGQRRTLERKDRTSLELASHRDAKEFFAHVTVDQDIRRICGVGPMYTMLMALPEGISGELLHYEQNVDQDCGSIVSHAAMTFDAKR
jgi:hypothetical protein